MLEISSKFSHVVVQEGMVVKSLSASPFLRNIYDMTFCGSSAVFDGIEICFDYKQVTKHHHTSMNDCPSSWLEKLFDSKGRVKVTNHALGAFCGIQTLTVNSVIKDFYD